MRKTAHGKIAPYHGVIIPYNTGSQLKYLKYTEKKHFDSLIENGSIKIGTLKNYRSSEHGTMVSDSMEGVKSLAGTYKELTSSGIKASQSLSSFIHIGEGGSLRDVSFSRMKFYGENYFIFSMSSIYRETDHKAWKEKENYDICYRINAPRTFFEKITQKLNELVPVKLLGVCKIHYYNENTGMDFFDPKNSYPAFMLKGCTGFAEQKEIRAVWQPNTLKDIEPIIINDTRLSTHVEYHRSL